MSKVELGTTYEDKITGFSGICTGKSEHLDGPDQVCLEAFGDVDRQRHCEWFAVSRLIEISSE